MSLWKILFIMFWNVEGLLHNPKNMMRGSNRPQCVMKAAFHSSPFLMHILLYPQHTSNLVKYFAPVSLLIVSDNRGRGYLFSLVTLFNFLYSWTGHSLPSFFWMKKKGFANGDLNGLIHPESKISLRKASNSDCLPWLNGYIFPCTWWFPGTSSIAWSQGF